MKIYINVSKKISNEYLVFRLIIGKTIFEHLLILAKKLNADKIALNLPEEKKDYANSLISKYFKANQYDFVQHTDDGTDLMLDETNIYNINKAVRYYKKFRNIEGAVIWKIKEEKDFNAAEEELVRSEWFPIGRYYIHPFSKLLAKMLAKTLVTPNQVTTLSLFVGLLASFLLIFKNHFFYIISAILFLFFWTLDIMDGQLARLKSQTSNFGSWFDNIVGEVIDYIAYLAIVYNLYTRDLKIWILWLGVFYFVGKHLFLHSMQTAKQIYINRRTDELFINLLQERKLIPVIIKSFYFLQDNDIRIHFLALAILLDATIVPLALYALYYNGWFFAKIIVEYYRYKTNK